MRGARTAALTAGLAFAWFPPSAEAVAWIAARFDGMALLWMLVAACAFMASRHWRDRYALASLAATVLAFMSKESAAIGPALIVALAWARRSPQDSLVRGIARALAWTAPWLVIGAAYFAYRRGSSAIRSGFIRGPRQDRRSWRESGSRRCPRAPTGGRR
jgi:hypothetical protein